MMVYAVTSIVPAIRQRNYPERTTPYQTGDRRTPVGTFDKVGQVTTVPTSIIIHQRRESSFYGHGEDTFTTQ